MKAKRTLVKFNKLLNKAFPFLVWGRTLNKRTLRADFFAGLTGAVIVLPQGVAYALIAGLPPEYGIYTAIITPVVAGMFGSSMHLVSGPTAAISIIVFSITSELTEIGSAEFISIALTLTLLTGLIQYGLGLARLGSLINFISHTVVIGFTAGAALLIGTSQMKYFLGVDIASGSSFIDSWHAIWQQMTAVNGYAISIAIITMISALAAKRINPRLPAMLIGMIVGSVACWLMGGAGKGIPLVGALPGTLPGLSMPDLSENTVKTVLPGALAVAILGLVEAVSIARAVGVRSGQRINGNQEFVGQGLSNVVGSFFSCYAGSGSFTRTGANYDSGARTPVSGIFAALILILILLLAPNMTAWLPLPAMAGVILLIVANLIDPKHVWEILTANRQEAAILLVTFASTLFLELEFAIYIGVILSMVLFLHRTSVPRLMVVAPKSHDSGTDLRNVKRFGLKECPQIKIVRIDGALYFGSIDHIQGRLQELCNANSRHKQLLLLCNGVNVIDIAGVNMLVQEQARLKQFGGSLHFCSLKNSIKDELVSMKALDKLGPANFYSTVDVALKILVPNLDKPTCDECGTRVFAQCPEPVLLVGPPEFPESTEQVLEIADEKQSA